MEFQLPCEDSHRVQALRPERSSQKPPKAVVTNTRHRCRRPAGRATTQKEVMPPATWTGLRGIPLGQKKKSHSQKVPCRTVSRTRRYQRDKTVSRMMVSQLSPVQWGQAVGQRATRGVRRPGPPRTPVQTRACTAQETGRLRAVPRSAPAPWTRSPRGERAALDLRDRSSQVPVRRRGLQNR